MNVLVACEYSGIVRDAFAAKGHYAVSCDFDDSISNGRHYKGNVKDIIDDGWDLMIAHPPCTYLCSAQIWLTKKDKDRQEKMKEASNFIDLLFNCKIPRVVIENPPGILNTTWKRHNQIIYPYMFGDPYKKEICLWYKNVPNLVIPHKDKWNNTRKPVSNHINGRMTKEQRSKRMSLFFPGVAKAMANQWSVFTDSYIPGLLSQFK